MKLRRKYVTGKKVKLSFILTVVFWISLLYFFFFVNPDNNLAITFFIVNFFFAMLFTLSIMLLNTRRGLMISIAGTFFLILRLVGVGNLLNLILIVGILTAIEFYFRKSY